ncbi:unnamed protein product, partial [Tetraodon nigroviridis]
LACAVDSEDAAARQPGGLVLESDLMLSGELEFGDSEIIGLDRDAGMTVFSLSVEDDPTAPTASAFPALLSCKACGQLLGDTPLGTGLGLGVGLDLGAELHCLSCQEGLRHEASAGNAAVPQASVRRRRRSVSRAAGPGDPAPRLYSCSLCTFTSHYSNHLKRHMRIHDGQKPYRCPACPYASAQLVNLQRHARTHTGEKPYRCHHCSYACSSLGNLRRHQRMHAQERPERREKEKPAARRKKGKAGGHEEGKLRSCVRVRMLCRPKDAAGTTATGCECVFPAYSSSLSFFPDVPPLLVGAAHRGRTGAPLPPGGVAGIAAISAGHQALPLPSLPLPVSLPQPPGPPRPQPLGGETPRLPALRLHLLAPGQPEAAPPRAHGREALPVPLLQLRLRQPGQPAAPRAHPLGRQALPLRRVRLLVQPEHEPEEAHAAAHGREAVRLRRVRLHHRTLGQLQTAPEEARAQHRQLGQTRTRQQPGLGGRSPGEPGAGTGAQLERVCGCVWVCVGVCGCVCVCVSYTGEAPVQVGTKLRCL